MEFQTSICPLKDDKACAVTFTADDGLYSSCQFYQSRFKAYGLRGTIMFTTQFMSLPGDKSGDFAGWEQWQAFLDEGFFDVANHSKTHSYLNQISAEQLEDEVNGAQEVLKEKFPGQRVVCMANPYVVTNDAIDAVIRRRHLSARNGGGGFNSLSPTEEEWYRLNFQIALHQSTAESMNPWIDEAMEKKLWLIELWHGVDGQGWEPPASEECDKHLAYLSQKLDTVWNGTMEEVTLYIRERQNARVITEFSGEEEIRISLKTDLALSVSLVPLTLKTAVPSDWNAVRLISGGLEKPLVVREVDGKKMVTFDAVPNTGTLVLRKA